MAGGLIDRARCPARNTNNARAKGNYCECMARGHF